MRIADIVHHGRAGLFQLLLIDQHTSGENQRLGTLAGGRKSALQEQFVEARLHGARLARGENVAKLANEFRILRRSDDDVHSALGSVHCVRNFESVQLRG